MKTVTTIVWGGVLVFLAILSFATDSSAQPRLRGIRCFGEGAWGSFFDVYAVAENGFVMCGTISPANGNNLTDDLYVVRCNAAGEQIWATSFGNEGQCDGAISIIELDNGDFAVAGYFDSICAVLRISSDGGLIWSRTYENAFFYAVIELKQGDLMLSGTWHNDGPSSSAYLMRINPENGNIIWGRSYGEFYQGKFWCLRETDENVVAAGFCHIRDEENHYLGKVLMCKAEQEEGDVVWLHPLDPRLPPDNPTEEARSIVSHPGGFVVSGIRREGQGSHYKGLSIKVDNDGEVLWRHETVLEEGGVFWNGICRLSNNDIVNVGQAGNNDGHPILQWLSPAGEVRWQQIFDVRNFGEFTFGRTIVFSASSTRENGVVFCGNILSTNQQRGWEAFIWESEPVAMLPILTWTPDDTLLEVLSGDSIRFTVVARDILQQQMDHLWVWNERDTVSIDTSVLVEFDELGFDTLRCTVSNGEGSVSVRWIIDVKSLYIVSYTPDTLSLVIPRGASGNFSIDSVASAGVEPVQYVWMLTNLNSQESVEVGDESEANLAFDFVGDYRVEGIAFRGEGEDLERDNVIWDVGVRGLILDFMPHQRSFSTTADSLLTFELTPFNPDSHDVHYRWRVNGEGKGTEPTIQLRLQGSNSGDTLHIIQGRVICGGDIDTVNWEVTVPAEQAVDLENHPTRVGLLSVTPNPFNSTVTIRYAGGLETAPTRLTIHDINGREVARLVETEAVSPLRLTATVEGVNHRGLTPYESVTWDASAFPAGIYFARLETGGELRTVKMALVR